MNRPAQTAGGILGVSLLLGGSQGRTQQSFQVRINRWLEVKQVLGKVIREQGAASYVARVGDRLKSVNDGITTGKNSSATLFVDTGIGTISLTENTRLKIQELAMAPDNGRITRLQVMSGQAVLRVRRFTHRGSRLEIRTPAGLSGVRGTEFGLTIQPSGKTGLAVREGNVVSSAQGQAVAVPHEFQNFTIPDEAPSTPTPLTEDTRIQYHFQQVIERRVRKIRLVGKVDPVNSVIVEGTPQSTNRDGVFITDFKLLPNSLKIQVEVITPLGKKEIHELAYR
ncbi:FecR family protein [Leptothermofonsia sp. ETS-13]|uniref:FecR family protein n=1 Tax=Leptothermofonsia sp. ETS-13 TaxID=3035696 RepID=UPI003B9FB20B